MVSCGGRSGLLGLAESSGGGAARVDEGAVAVGGASNGGARAVGGASGGMTSVSGAANGGVLSGVGGRGFWGWCADWAVADCESSGAAGAARESVRLCWRECGVHGRLV